MKYTGLSLRFGPAADQLGGRGKTPLPFCAFKTSSENGGEDSDNFYIKAIVKTKLSNVYRVKHIKLLGLSMAAGKGLNFVS